MATMPSLRQLTNESSHAAVLSEWRKHEAETAARIRAPLRHRVYSASFGQCRHQWWRELWIAGAGDSFAILMGSGTCLCPKPCRIHATPSATTRRHARAHALTRAQPATHTCSYMLTRSTVRSRSSGTRSVKPGIHSIGVFMASGYLWHRGTYITFGAFIMSGHS